MLSRGSCGNADLDAHVLKFVMSFNSVCSLASVWMSAYGSRLVTRVCCCEQGLRAACLACMNTACYI